LHETLSIGPNASETVYFSNSGNYFTKTKAVLKGKDPIYRKGQPFFVTNDMTGYSVLTLTFSITESSVPKASGGRAISKGEFDQN
jgi:peptidoglycan hydrolase-like amidase